MDISAAQPAEAAILSQIARTAKAHWGYPGGWLAQWESALTLTPGSVSTQPTYVAREAGTGRALGFYSLGERAGRLELEHLWVLPAAMGRGVGRALLRHAQGQGWELGYGHFELEADPHAAGFYERVGAERVGSRVGWLGGQRRELPVYRCRTQGEGPVA